MTATRLFIGGLDQNVCDRMLTSKLSSYGSITNVEIKEKTDAEGNIILRFAYVNIEATQNQLKECISTLHGSSWQGSHLRIEIAKESFLDRLKRERAKRLEQQQTLCQTDVTAKAAISSSDNGRKTKEYNVIHKKKKRNWQNIAIDSGVLVGESNYITGKYMKPKKEVDIEHTKRENDEEIMLESFKSFSSVWADSDEEEGPRASKLRNAMKMQQDKELIERTSNSNIKEDKRQNWGSPQKPVSSHSKMDSDGPTRSMTRYDPTLPEHQHFRIASPTQVELKVKDVKTKEKLDPLIHHKPQQALMFGQELEKGKDEKKVEENQKATKNDSSSFSLLSLFDQLHAEKKNEKDMPLQHKQQEPHLVKSESREVKGSNNEDDKIKVTVPSYLQRKPFFLVREDERILDGIDWMKRYDYERVLSEFMAIENDIYDVIKTRSDRARKSFYKKSYEQSKRERDPRGKLKFFSQAPLPEYEDNHYDHGWREAEAIQNAEKRSKKNSENESGEDKCDTPSQQNKNVDERKG